ncbi:MAG TPA: hypothetical protein EYO58_11540, partial [Flavobacteriales bacterium]|nr:hypothetical protein [Flavobacteriales bacterium]
MTPATDISYEHFLKLKNQLDDLGNEWSAIPKDARAGWLGFMPVRYVDRDGASIREAVDLCAGELGDLNAELCKLGAQDTAAYLFELERLLSLEKTSPSQTLKDIPIGVDENIISRVVKHESVDDFRALISDIDDYLGTVKSVNETFDYSDNDSNNYAELLRQHSSRLAGVAVQPELEVNQLEGESEVFSKVVRYLAGLSEDSSYVLGLTNQVSRTIADYIEVTESADGLMQGPIELSLHSTPTHVNASVTNYLSQAKENHSRI